MAVNVVWFNFSKSNWGTFTGLIMGTGAAPIPPFSSGILATIKLPSIIDYPPGSFLILSQPSFKNSDGVSVEPVGVFEPEVSVLCYLEDSV